MRETIITKRHRLRRCIIFAAASSACSCSVPRRDSEAAAPLQITAECANNAAAVASAETFTLTDPVEGRWPKAERWYLAGIRVSANAPGNLLFDVISGHSVADQLAWATKAIPCGKSDFVIGFSFESESSSPFTAGSIQINEWSGSGWNKFAEFSIPRWAVPKTHSALDSGWLPYESWTDKLGATLSDSAIARWSWNGHGTHAVARPGERVHRIFEGVYSQRACELADIPVRDWPEPVWFLRLAYVPLDSR